MQQRLTTALLLTTLLLVGCDSSDEPNADNKNNPNLTWDDNTKTWNESNWK